MDRRGGRTDVTVFLQIVCGQAAHAIRFAAMPAKKKSSSSPETVRAAERKFKEALAHAKTLKAQSRDAKRKLKQAKKAAKQALRAARVARKEAAKLRRRHEKTATRAKPRQSKAPRSTKGARVVARRGKARTTAPGGPMKPRVRRIAPTPPPEPTPPPQAPGVDFDVAFSAGDLTTLEPH
jgi:hypothetical protein